MKWFYERVRGQYDEAKRLLNTKAKQKTFSQIYPSHQKFTKTELAKYENTWHQLPHLVSRGAQKNFAEFTLKLSESSNNDIDVTYFKHLIAKTILFKETEVIVQSQSFRGYKANIVTYTLAYISYRTNQQLNLDIVWERQTIQEPLPGAIRLVSVAIYKSITSASKGQNVTEWCKKEDCWKQIKRINVNLPESVF